MKVRLYERKIAVNMKVGYMNVRLQ
jgi:hypothetical protein